MLHGIGTVESVDAGAGFVDPDGPTASVYFQGAGHLTAGDRVEFDVIQTPTGPNAINMTRI